MTAIINRIGDRLLAAFLPTKDAAACYWAAGHDCSACRGRAIFCSGGFEYQRYEKNVYDCAGLCGTVWKYCYNKKIGTC